MSERSPSPVAASSLAPILAARSFQIVALHCD
jgi:hypothetical protein